MHTPYPCSLEFLGGNVPIQMKMRHMGVMLAQGYVYVRASSSRCSSELPCKGEEFVCCRNSEEKLGIEHGSAYSQACDSHTRPSFLAACLTYIIREKDLQPNNKISPLPLYCMIVFITDQ